MITIESKGKGDLEFAGLLWVLKVRSKDESKTYQGITGVNVEAGWFTCTDGMRLHSFASNYDVTDGVYEVKVSSKKLVALEKTDNKYPDVDAFMCGLGWNQVFHVTTWPPHKQTHYVSELYRKTPSEMMNGNRITYDLDYVLDSYIPDAEIKGWAKEAGEPLVITSEGYCALIMPMRE